MLSQNEVNPIKMLFFKCLPERCLKKFSNKSCCRLCRRTDSYNYFDQGLEKYFNEIDIVKIIRDLRNLKAASELLIKNNPKLENKLKKMKRRQTTIELANISTGRVEEDELPDPIDKIRKSNSESEGSHGNFNGHSHMINEESLVGFESEIE